MEAPSGLRDPRQAAEVARIEAAYSERDASGVEGRYRFGHPGYAFYTQLLEWSLLEALRRSPVELAQARLLDVGCGTGYFVHRLVEFGAEAATGVDLMPARVEAARRRYPEAHFVRANAAELPFDDGGFDIAMQFVCFSSVIDAGLRRAIAAEMWRVVRPGGIVVSYDIRPEPGPLRARRWLRTRRLRRQGQVTPSLTPTIGISEDELRRLFPEASLQYASAGLDFELCAIAHRSYLAARLLASVPLLRAHGIGVLVKPSRAEMATQAA
jgi:SAM-dependent methyltransferase